MAHAKHCIPSEGDWICAPGCTHDLDARQSPLAQVAS